MRNYEFDAQFANKKITDMYKSKGQEANSPNTIAYIIMICLWSVVVIVIGVCRLLSQLEISNSEFVVSEIKNDMLCHFKCHFTFEMIFKVTFQWTFRKD